MKNKGVFTKILAVLGTFLVLLPVAAMVVFGVERFLRAGIFQVDYLLPAEAFPVTLVGCGLLIWAAARARTRIKQILSSLGAAVAVIFVGQAVAMATGLASGRAEPEGWRFALLLGAILLFNLLIVVIGSYGVLLTRDLFRA